MLTALTLMRARCARRRGATRKPAGPKGTATSSRRPPPSGRRRRRVASEAPRQWHCRPRCWPRRRRRVTTRSTSTVESERGAAAGGAAGGGAGGGVGGAEVGDIGDDDIDGDGGDEGIGDDGLGAGGGPQPQAPQPQPARAGVQMVSCETQTHRAPMPGSDPSKGAYKGPERNENIYPGSSSVTFCSSQSAFCSSSQSPSAFRSGGHEGSLQAK